MYMSSQADFSPNRVNPLYYVTFTTATLCASFILYQGFNTTDAVNTLSLLSGFLVIFTGVYLLNLSRGDPDGHRLLRGGNLEDGVPTDGLATLHTRRSMQSRQSVEVLRRASLNAAFSSPRGDTEGLMHSYDEDNQALRLTHLAVDVDEEGVVSPHQITNGVTRKYSGNFKGHDR